MKGQIEKRGEGVYRLRWYQGRDAQGTRQYGSETVKGTRKAAEKRLREVLGQGDRGHALPSPARIPRLRDFVKAWEKTETAARLRERTRRDYLDLLGRHVLPHLGGHRLDTIRAHTIETTVVAPLRADGKLRTARLAVAALSNVFRAAVKDPTLGLVGNPCFGVEVGRRPRQAVKPLDAEERAAFREAIRGTPHETLWLLMMQPALGPGEALGLGWEHLDLEGGELRLVRTLDCKGRRLVDDVKRPKRLRTLPLPPEVRRTLREQWLAQGRPVAGLVFADRHGAPLDLDNLRARAFRPALRAAGISRAVRIYDLRHGFATAALEAGADVRTVADLMGHSSTRTTENVYQHVSGERKREAAERIWRHLGTVS